MTLFGLPGALATIALLLLGAAALIGRQRLSVVPAAGEAQVVAS